MPGTAGTSSPSRGADGDGKTEMSQTLRKYNPGFLTDDELVASYCVRTEEFDSIVEMLRESDDRSNPHRIVIGPRGSGKTSLLLRVAAEIRRDACLSRRFFPVVLAEESYEVGSAGEFWLECLSRLADQAPPRGDAPDLGRTVEDLRAIRDDRTLGDRCLGALLDFADRERVRLVLIVENLNMLFQDMADPETEWRLRQTLQTEPGIFLLGSATSRFDAIDDSDRALFDLFKLVFLRPLDAGDCAVLWERVSERRPAPETVRALRILTGGSPRLIAILARFGANRSFGELMGELLDLVDDHTEYFKSHLDALPAQERRVYLALADLWKPATTREVADRTRLDTSKCSAQLGRLVDRGAVEVTGGGPRRKQYYLTERLYNIYYLLRRSRGPEPMIEALVRFMEAFYSPRELADIGVALFRDYDVDAGSERFAGPMLRRLIDSPALAAHRDEMLAALREGLGKDPTRSSVLRVVAGTMGFGGAPIPPATDPEIGGVETSGELKAARELFDNAVALAEDKRIDDALVGFDETIRRFGDADSPDVLAWVASALVLKGDILAGLYPEEDGWVYIRDAVHRVWNGDAPVLSEIVSMGLTGSKIASDRAPEALAVYDEVLRRFGKSDAPALLGRVAVALLSKAAACLVLERTEDALATLDDAIFRFGEADAASPAEIAATAFFMRGHVLLSLDRAEAALASLEEAVRGFQRGDASGAADTAAYANLCHGLAQFRLGRTEDALTSWDTAAGLLARSETSLLVEMAAVTQVQKAVTLADLDRMEEALAACDEALRIFRETGSPVFPQIAAAALVDRAYLLGKLNRIGEALATLDEAMARFANDDAPAFPELSAKALCTKGELLAESDRDEEALDAFREAIERFGEGDTPAILETVAKSFFHKANILHRLGRSDDALSAFDEAALRFRECNPSELVEWEARVLVKKAEVLRKLERPDEALAVNDEVVQRFGGCDLPALLGHVMAARVGRGFAFLGLNRPAEALHAFGNAVERVGEHDPPGVLPLFALAHVGRGITLRALDRWEEALAAFDEAAHHFARGNDPLLRQSSRAALVDKAGLELRLERYAAAVETASRALDPSIMLSAENRTEGYLIRAKAALAGGDPSALGQDIEAILTLLPKLDSLPGEALDILMALSIDLGPERVLALIRSSPSATALLPLATALELELGTEPRVAREVEEVAMDIRKRLAKMKEDAKSMISGAVVTEAELGGNER